MFCNTWYEVKSNDALQPESNKTLIYFLVFIAFKCIIAYYIYILFSIRFLS